jgi:hypothetical protein
VKELPREFPAAESQPPVAVNLSVLVLPALRLPAELAAARALVQPAVVPAAAEVRHPAALALGEDSQPPRQRPSEPTRQRPGPRKRYAWKPRHRIGFLLGLQPAYPSVRRICLPRTETMACPNEH